MLLDHLPIIIGAVHLPRYGVWDPKKSIAEIEDYVLTNCGIFYQNGIRCLYLQDENPVKGPAAPETIALMSSLGRLIKKEFPQLELGIIVEAHDGIAPIAIAKACGASFVRIKVFAGAMLKGPGIQEGCGIEATRYRVSIGAETQVQILADVHDRMGYPLREVPIETAAGWASRAGADALILTGMTYAQSLAYIDACRSKVKKPILIGGSVTVDNIAEVLEHCDGAVVSSSLMLDSPIPGSCAHWDGEKVRRFMEIVEGTRR